MYQYTAHHSYLIYIKIMVLPKNTDEINLRRIPPMDTLMTELATLWICNIINLIEAIPQDMLTIGFSIVFLCPPQAKLQGVLWVWLVTTSRLSYSLHYHIIKKKSGYHRADSLVLGMLGRTLTLFICSSQTMSFIAT